MIGKWLRKKIAKSQIVQRMKGLKTSPLGRIKPDIVFIEGKASLCLECVPCEHEMHWHESPGGWSCPSCEYFVDYRQSYAMFCEVSAMIDNMVVFLETQTLSTSENDFTQE